MVRLVLPMAFAFAAMLLPADSCSADDPQADEDNPLLEWMQEYAEGTRIRLGADEDAPAAEMIERPVFRYSDVEREIPDATLWVWTRDARPVAFQKVEVNAHRGGKLWTICFASLSEDLLEVEWPARPARRHYASTEPGVTFAPIPDAGPPSELARLRSRQIRRLTERFEGRLGTAGVLRVIPRPIFEYSDPESDLPVGAIFGLTATGTNPDGLLLIEAREDNNGELRWEYAAAQMTTSSVTLTLDDETAWVRPGVANNNNVQPNWTFYFMSRRLEVPTD